MANQIHRTGRTKYLTSVLTVLVVILAMPAATRAQTAHQPVADTVYRNGSGARGLTRL